MIKIEDKKQTVAMQILTDAGFCHEQALAIAAAIRILMHNPSGFPANILRFNHEP